MTRTHSPMSLEYLISTFLANPATFWSHYDRTDDTDALAQSATTHVIQKCEHSLRTAHEVYRLDKLLSAMLTEAPHPSGKRYVAASLLAAQALGEAAVVELAKRWMENLFLPLFALSAHLAELKIESRESGSELDEPKSDFMFQVAEREQHRCAITNLFDGPYAISLDQAGKRRDIPPGPQSILEAAHIIPFRLDTHGENRSTENLTPEEKDTIIAWNVFCAWTGLDPSDLTAEKLNSPANGILLAPFEHHLFRTYELYFDKDSYPQSPNKYEVRLVRGSVRLTNGKTGGDVEFQTVNGIQPPSPSLLKVHSSFAWVIHDSGVVRYYDSLDVDDDGPFLMRNLSILPM